MSSESQSGTEQTPVYHAPKGFGTCDGCDHPFKRATHRMPNGDDLCGFCYGVRMGYVDCTVESGTNQEGRDGVSES